MSLPPVLLPTTVVGSYPTFAAFLAEQALWAAAHRFEEAKTPAASQLARLAWNIDRSIPSTALWWKILVKRTLGPRLWRALAKAAA